MTTRDCPVVWRVGARGAAKHSTVHRIAPRNPGGFGSKHWQCLGGNPCRPALLPAQDPAPRTLFLSPVPLAPHWPQETGRPRIGVLTNFISRLFMFVFCFLLETCRLHVCATVCKPSTPPDQKCPPTRDPHRLAGHRTDSTVLPRPAASLWPLSAHNVQPLPPTTRTDRPSRTPFGSDTEMPQPERLR